jgi:hypothetical protein
LWGQFNRKERFVKKKNIPFITKRFWVNEREEEWFPVASHTSSPLAGL